MGSPPLGQQIQLPRRLHDNISRHLGTFKRVGVRFWKRQGCGPGDGLRVQPQKTRFKPGFHHSLVTEQQVRCICYLLPSNKWAPSVAVGNNCIYGFTRFLRVGNQVSMSWVFLAPGVVHL